MSEKIVLIDGNSIINRAFYGIPQLSNSKGIHTNAVYGFMNILLKILDEEKPEYLAVAFDLKAPTFRHKMYAEYKGTRKGMPEELREQVPILKDLLRAMNILVVEMAGYEADDLLGTMAKKAESLGLQASVISGDRDLLQLATPNIKIRIPKSKMSGTEIEDYYPEDVVAKYQVTPLQIIELKALMGDTSDNITGVPGIGEKGATKIIVEFGSIENAYANVDKVTPTKARNALREHYDMAVLSKKLATIEIHAPLEWDLEQASLGQIYTQEAYQIFKDLELKKLIERFSKQMTKAGETVNFADGAQENQVEILIHIVKDLEEIEKVFEEAEKQARIGLSFVGKEELQAVTLSYGADKTFCMIPEGFVTGDFLLEKIEKLTNKVSTVSMFSLKEKLKIGNFTNKNQWFDGEIAAYLLNPMQDTYTYDDVAKDYLDMTLPSKQELLGKITLEQAVLDESQEELTGKVLSYEAYVSYASVEPLKKALAEGNMLSLFEEIEMPLAFVLKNMEQEGIAVDKAALVAYGEQLVGQIALLEQEIYGLAGERFNINSPKQLGEILFEKLGLPNGKKTKTGYSTAADVLEKLQGDYPIVGKILEYRTLSKLNSTYAQGLLGCIKEDGRIHTTFQQTVTATGRLSSTEPNLQNIPVRLELGRLIRKVFVPKDGYVFMDADYSQIELRVLAHLSQDENLIQAYNQEEDIHRMTASQVFHVPLEEVTPQLRRNAKAVNFGIVYGISSFGLSQDLSITRKEAAVYMDKYFATYPKVKEFMDNMVAKAKEDGLVTTMFGRKRPIPEIKSSNFMQRSFGERIAMNSPVQGAAADIIKIAMVRVAKRLEEEQLKSRLLLQVHDELLIETAIEEEAQVAGILEEEMKGAAKLAVPLEIDMHTGENWYEAK